MSVVVLRSVGFVLFAACFAATESLPAQEQKPGEKKKNYDPSVEKVQELRFQDTDRGLNTLAAIAVAQPGGPNPWGTIGERVVASRLVPLADEWHFVFEKALPLDQGYLDVIKDRRPLPDLQYRELKELHGSDLGIYLALNEALHRADQANQDMFERSAADNKHVTYADLNKQPREHRGQVVSVKGKLIVLRKVKAPRLVTKEMEFVYTAYVQGLNKGIPPYTIVFTELPPTLEVGEEQTAIVTMHGYFLGLIRFQADKENRDVQRDVVSPYLVGKTLIVNSTGLEKAAGQESHSYVLIVTVLTCFVVMAVFGAVALAWLKRGDSKIQSKLAQVRDKHTPFNLEPSEESTPPLNPDMGFKNEPRPPH